MLCSLSLYSQQGITYNDFIENVKANNPLAGKASNVRELGVAQYKAARGSYDPVISSLIENKHFENKNYYTAAFAEIKQPVFSSHYLKAGYQYGSGPFLNPEKVTPVAGLPYLGVEANLLQGLVIDKRRTDLLKGRYYAEFYNAEEKIQMNDLLYASSLSYFNYIYTLKVNSLFRYFERLAKERLNGINALSIAGERPAVDTIEAAIYYQSRQLDKQASEVERSKYSNQLNVFFKSKSPDASLPFTITDSIEQVYDLCKNNFTMLLAANTINPELTQYNAKQNILNIESRFKREMIKPVLTVNYNFLSAAPDNGISYFNQNNYKWGATFSFPLFVRKSLNEYRMAVIQGETNSLEQLNKQNEISFKRQTIIQTLEITVQQIMNAEKSSNYCKLLVEAERLKFTNGESSLFLLNARENKWLEAELKLVEYKLKFIQTVIELIHNDGSLNYQLR
ncbi:MAG: outer rane efflux protein [Bacteroidota bacterium]|nr:outer rane efflux protein [Bacteroidota bacterium]